MTTYSIRQVSEKFQLPPSTLRYYEEVGLLTNIERQGQQRIYQQQHLNRLGAIQCFKATGMSIHQIQTFFYHEDETHDYEAIITLLSDQCDAVEAQLDSLLSNQHHIQAKLAFYQAKKTAYEQQQPAPQWREYADHK